MRLLTPVEPGVLALCVLLRLGRSFDHVYWSRKSRIDASPGGWSSTRASQFQGLSPFSSLSPFIWLELRAQLGATSKHQSMQYYCTSLKREQLARVRAHDLYFESSRAAKRCEPNGAASASHCVLLPKMKRTGITSLIHCICCGSDSSQLWLNSRSNLKLAAAVHLLPCFTSTESGYRSRRFLATR